MKYYVYMCISMYVIYVDNTLRTIPANPINNEANPLRNDEQLK